jgi:hypothetical protein
MAKTQEKSSVIEYRYETRAEYERRMVEMVSAGEAEGDEYDKLVDEYLEFTSTRRAS